MQSALTEFAKNENNSHHLSQQRTREAIAKLPRWSEVFSSENSWAKDGAMDQSKAKRKHFTIRLSLDDFLAVRNNALARGLEVGPMLESWIRPHIDAIMVKPVSARSTESDSD